MTKSIFFYVAAFMIFNSCAIIPPASSTDSLSQTITDMPTLEDYQVGEKWTWIEKSVAGEKIRWEGEDRLEVVSYGEVTVLAGRFMAYKIEYKGTITNSIGGSAKIKEAFWYAPALKTNIRHVQDDGYGSYVLELYDYKSGK